MIIPMGSKARDVITGFEGTLTGHAEYITGCDQYLLVAPSKDGKDGEHKWVDEARLERVGEDVVQLPAIGKPGADHPAPIR